MNFETLPTFLSRNTTGSVVAAVEAVPEDDTMEGSQMNQCTYECNDV